MRIRPALIVLVALSATLPACSWGRAIGSSINEGMYRLRGGYGDDTGIAADVGLAPGYTARIVIDGLQNPSGVTFSRSGDLTVCDSGRGRVLVLRSGRTQEYVTGFATEHWKVDPETGTKRFLLGPLSAVWLPDGCLAVTDGGRLDGEETVRFYQRPGDAASGRSSNAVGPSTTAAGDLGEGNLTGMALHPDGRLFICGQGADAASWLLTCTTGGASPRLRTFASADAAGIAVNSPMQALITPRGHVLVLYSGTGGEDDGLIARWHAKTGALMGTWTLPGLTDPMGMAYVPGSNDLVVVDNNWALTEVKSGRLARVTLGPKGGDAEVNVLGTELRGPVSCAFGPDGRLYVAELGAAFDSGVGRVIAISGF